MKKSKRKYIVGLVLLAVVVVVLARAFWPLPNTPLIISKQTTYFTSPLNPDGTVDYVAAFNEHFGSHVQPEDNMAAVVVDAIGPDAIWEPARETVLDTLAVELPRDRKYLIDSEPFVDAHAEEFKKLMPEPPPKSDAELQEEEELRAIAGDISADTTPFEDFVYGQLIDARGTPWTAEEYPIVAAWLAANKEPLARFMSAPMRPEFFIPKVSQATPAEFEVEYYAFDRMQRELVRALTSRAMLMIGDGDVTGAAGIAMRLCYMGRLMSRQGSGTSFASGDMCWWYGARTLVTMAQSGRLSCQQAKAILAEYDRLPSGNGKAETIALLSRLSTLDIVMRLARNPQTLSMMKLKVTVPTTSTYDLNDILRRINEAHDKLYQAVSQADYASRRKQTEEWWDAYDNNQDVFKEETLGKVKSRFGQTCLFLSSSSSKRRWANDAMFGLIMDMGLRSTAVSNDLEFAMLDEFVRISLALAAYRADEGEYPAELSALTPKYLSEIPHDFFTGEPLHYVREGESYRLWSVGSDEEDDGGYEIHDVGFDLPNKE